MPTMSKWQWSLVQTARRLWVRAALIGSLGVAAAILATLAERLLPTDLPIDISAEALDRLLSIIASSMLAVTTFSLSVMTSAYQSATSNATPRATKLLVRDNISQTVLSTFVGSFLFSIVGLIVLKTGAYGPQGRGVLFAVTILVIALIVISLLRWIDYLTQLGRVENAADQVEVATRKALLLRRQSPYLGGLPFKEGMTIPHNAKPVRSAKVGYIQHIDMNQLSTCILGPKATLYLVASPGSFVFPDTPVAWIHLNQAELDEADFDQLCRSIMEAITIKDERTFDQDPRFGLCVLSEIATRALSPGINDSGTAIDVIGRLTRLLHLWAEADARETDTDVQFASILVPPLMAADLFDDAFNLIARDGSGQIEVQVRLRKSLKALSRIGDVDFRQAALAQSDRALKRAQAGLVIDDDKACLKAIAVRD